jgi:hypothetical protein
MDDAIREPTSSSDADESLSRTQSATSGTDPRSGGEPQPQKAVDPDALFRRAYNSGLEKGQARMLADLGVQSIDDLKSIIEKTRTVADSDGDADAPKKDHEKLLRSLREERRALQKEIDQIKAESARYQAQASRALTADLQARLLGAGAHADAVGDLVKLLAQNLAWSSDGTELEVVERDASGSVTPSRLTIDEFIDQQKTQKPWFFAGRIKQGAGSNPGAAHQESAPEGYDFRRAYDQWSRRRT